MQLIASRDNENSWAKAIAMLRHGFGGHPFGEDDHIKKERAEGQIERILHQLQKLKGASQIVAAIDQWLKTG